MHYTQAVVSLKEIKAFWSACAPGSRGGRYPQTKKKEGPAAHRSRQFHVAGMGSGIFPLDKGQNLEVGESG